LKKTATKTVTDAMNSVGLSQKKMADKMGLKAQQAVFNMLNAKNGMRVDNFIKMINILGYDVIVRNRVTDEETEVVVEVGAEA